MKEMNKIKVNDMPYARPNKDELIKKIKEFGERFDKANSASEQLDILKDYCSFNDEVSTMGVLSFIRFSQNTKDEFYTKENDFFDEVNPEISLATVEFAKKIYNSKFRKELEEVFTPQFFKSIELDMKISDERLVPLKVEESKLTSEYTKLMSGITVEFNNETLTPAGMAKYAFNPDRELRKNAYTTLGKKYMEVSDQVSDIYDKLVDVRTRQGKLLGYDGFSPVGYARMGRTCYNKEDIAKFRANVKKYFVPLVSKIKKIVKDKLGLDKICFYDDSIYTIEPTTPYGTVEEKFDAAQKMYDSMSEDTSELFRHMREIEAFDVLAREGKWGGGYMIEIPLYKTPFILANFNGSSDDIATFTHEFGHSLNGYFNFKLPYHQLYSLCMETAECHSMSMEFLTYPWMDLFFKERTDDFKFTHIAQAIAFIPYGTIVDAFQQEVYDNPNMTKQERIELWARLEKEFIPYMDNSGIPFYGEGRRWQRQAHIIESPFYYIDYCLAQFTAFQFLSLSLKDYDTAVNKYMTFSKLGPTRSFVELLELSGLKSPFKEESFIDITKSIEELLKI